MEISKVLRFGDPQAERVLVQMVEQREAGELDKEETVLRKQYDGDFCLTAVQVNDWNKDLSPWEASAVFGDEAFGGGAADTLEAVLGLCSDLDKIYYIGGYSLAGLFALWAAYQTDLFRGVAAASPSMWFPGFLDYMKENEIKSSAVYLSLGDREEKTNNKVMSTVGDMIREAHDLLTERGVNCTLEWNKGNHFKEPDIRTAKAFAWVLQQE